MLACPIDDKLRKERKRGKILSLPIFDTSKAEYSELGKDSFPIREKF